MVMSENSTASLANSRLSLFVFVSSFALRFDPEVSLASRVEVNARLLLV